MARSWPRAPFAATGCAVVLVILGLTGCARGPQQTTAVVFDGQSRSVTGPVTCVTQPDGDLLILANGDDHDRLRVLLARNHQLVVEKVSMYVAGARGYTDDTGQMWASEVDDTYTIHGRMPANEGETDAHQFEIHVRCEYEMPQPGPNPGVADQGP